MGGGASLINGGEIRVQDGPALAGTAIALQNKLNENTVLNWDTCMECFSLYKRASDTITHHFPGKSYYVSCYIHFMALFSFRCQSWS